MQDVGEQKLLVLLLVMQADFKHCEYPLELRRLGLSQQLIDGCIDMGAIGGDLLATGSGEQTASRTRVARASGDVIRVEQICEPLIEDLISGKMHLEQELLEKPGRVRAVPLHGARVRHRLHRLIFGAQRRRTPLGFRAHGSESRAPALASLTWKCARERGPGLLAAQPG
jgi:hypothetical protein